MHPLIEANKKYEELYSGWFKNLLGISTGALAVLVALMPDSEIPSPDKYALAASWVSFAICIMCALVASFREVNIAQMNLHLQAAAINSPPDKFKVEKTKKTDMLKTRMLIITYCQFLSVFSFVAAFVSLATYACLRTI